MCLCFFEDTRFDLFNIFGGRAGPKLDRNNSCGVSLRKVFLYRLMFKKKVFKPLTASKETLSNQKLKTWTSVVNLKTGEDETKLKLENIGFIKGF